MMTRKTKRPGYLTKYAEHAGITKTAAAEQLKRVGIDYMQPFSFEEADRKRKAARSADRMPFAKPIYADKPSGEESPPDGDEDIFVYAEHQAKREFYRAEMARLEFEERIHQLIEVETVDAEWFRLARLVRDTIMNVPSRLAGVLASESDERKIHEILDRELRQALEEINKTQATRAA